MVIGPFRHRDHHQLCVSTSCSDPRRFLTRNTAPTKQTDTPSRTRPAPPDQVAPHSGYFPPLLRGLLDNIWVRVSLSQRGRVTLGAGASASPITGQPHASEVLSERKAGGTCRRASAQLPHRRVASRALGQPRVRVPRAPGGGRNSELGNYGFDGNGRLVELDGLLFQLDPSAQVIKGVTAVWTPIGSYGVTRGTLS